MGHVLWIAQSAPTQNSGDSTVTATDTEAAFWGVLVHGAVAIVLVAVLQFVRMLKGGYFSATCGR